MTQVSFCSQKHGAVVCPAPVINSANPNLKERMLLKRAEFCCGLPCPQGTPPQNGENNQYSSVSEPCGSVEIFLSHTCRLHLWLQLDTGAFLLGWTGSRRVVTLTGPVWRSLSSFAVYITFVRPVFWQGHRWQRTSIPNSTIAIPGHLLLLFPLFSTLFITLFSLLSTTFCFIYISSPCQPDEWFSCKSFRLFQPLFPHISFIFKVSIGK